jgi:hypothetical protein
VFDFALTDEEMERIAALKRPDGRIAKPASVLDFPSEIAQL